MKLTLFFIFLFFYSLVGSINAQTSRTIYFAATGKASSPSDASYYSIIAQDKKDTIRFAVGTFFLSGDRKESGDYLAITFPVAWEKLHESHFQDAVRDGQWEEYYNNGQLKFEGKYQQGLGVGKHRRWYETGKLLSELALVKGRDEGKVISYHENGKISTQYETSNGRLEGEWREYYIDGRKKTRATFHNGLLVGEVTYYDSAENEGPKKNKDDSN